MNACDRWLNWKPKGSILEKTTKSEPTKPTKPGSVGFVGATLGETPKIETANTALKGHAIEIWYQDGGIWLVADDDDAHRMIQRGATRGDCITSSELELIGRIDDQELRDALLIFKRELDATLSGVHDQRNGSGNEWP